MTVENFLVYQQVDPNSRFTVTSGRVTWSGLTRNEDAYVYDDKGANYFDGDFSHLLTLKITAGEGASVTHAVWLISDAVDSYDGIWGAGKNALSLDYYYSSGQHKLYLNENVGTGNSQSSAYQISLNTPYYLKIVRNESVGTYGTLYCYIYSDADRTTLLDTLSLALTVKNDFQYIYPINTYNAGGAQETDGYVELLELKGDLLPEVTQTSPTDITSTTATGNGHIVSEGQASVTEHGHCWNTTGDPTTADSKTTNGAGSVGDYTSSITGLTPGTKYYVRAYATNSHGTSYSNEAWSFIAGASSSVGEPGEIFASEANPDEFHHIGSDGKDYKHTGTAV